MHICIIAIAREYFLLSSNFWFSGGGSLGFPSNDPLNGPGVTRILQWRFRNPTTAYNDYLRSSNFL